MMLIKEAIYFLKRLNMIKANLECLFNSSIHLVNFVFKNSFNVFFSLDVLFIINLYDFLFYRD